MVRLAMCCVYVVFISLLISVPASCEGEAGRPTLTFTTFPSKGIGLFYERALTEAYARIGYNVEIRRLPGKRALDSANNGEVDGEAGRLAVVAKSNPNLIQVPTPIFRSDLTAFVRNHAVDVSDGWESLRLYRTGVLLGYKYVENKTEGNKRLLHADYEVLFNALDGGRIDLVVVTYLDGLAMIQELDCQHIEPLFPPLESLPLYHFLHKKHEALVPMIDAVFKEMIEDGSFNRIADEVGEVLQCKKGQQGKADQ